MATAEPKVLTGAIVTIIVVLVAILEIGNRFAAKQPTVSNSPGQAVLTLQEQQRRELWPQPLLRSD